MTPIPTESMGACMRFMRRDKPDMKNDQMVAICLDMMRKKGGKDTPPEKPKGA